jgi:hypothetical protein
MDQNKTWSTHLMHTQNTKFDGNPLSSSADESLETRDRVNSWHFFKEHEASPFYPHQMRATELSSNLLLSADEGRERNKDWRYTGAW